MFKVINEKPGGINLRVTGRVIIVGAADAGVGNRARSENKALLDAEALRGGDRGARQGEALVDGDGGTEIAAASRGVSDDVVEALGGPVGAGLVRLDEIEVKDTGGAASSSAMRGVVVVFLRLLVLVLAGLFTPPSGHVLSYWTKHKDRVVQFKEEGESCLILNDKYV
ncbi:hypothetical protein AAZV13_16G039700 [Glycine max]|uniref:Uncharacterized protein n=1 Tax=Glycine max TaxID=3847 RepID=K7MF66_SOYBN|nr:hypothetical protein GYH30_044119 [Glycine max]KAH1204858.1 hypothetical protein GmHk_16G045709 [Glycine max]